MWNEHIHTMGMFHEYWFLAAIARSVTSTYCMCFFLGGDTDMPNIGIPTYNNFRFLTFYGTIMNSETYLFFIIKPNLKIAQFR